MAGTSLAISYRSQCSAILGGARSQTSAGLGIPPARRCDAVEVTAQSFEVNEGAGRQAMLDGVHADRRQRFLLR